MIPGSRGGYKTTSGAFKWTVLISILGGIAMVLLFRQVFKDADQMYENAGFPDRYNFFKK